MQPNCSGFKASIQQTAKHLKGCLPPLYILQLEDKTQKLVAVKGLGFFVLTVSPCYFTRLAVRNTRKAWEQPNYYGRYLKAKEKKTWENTQVTLPLQSTWKIFAKEKRSRTTSS